MFQVHVEDETDHPPSKSETVRGKGNGAENHAAAPASAATGGPAVHHEPPAIPAPPPVVLCVEDSTPDFYLIQQYLAEVPHSARPILRHASTLQQGLAFLRTPPEAAPINCILVDLSLPDSRGPETFSIIQRAAPEIPIIVLTGREDDDLAFEMVKQGAQDYLAKDQLGGFMLLKTIRYAIERQRLSQRLRSVHGELHHTQITLEQAQRQLIQADKLDSIGRMAAGVAHEVKNPLGVLQMGVDYFREKGVGVDAMDTTVLSYMQDAITRADTIIHGMLNFSRANDFELRPVYGNDVVKSSLQMVSHEFMKRKLEVSTELASHLPLTLANEGQLQQVLINILHNAAQAVPVGGRIEVRTFLLPPDPVVTGPDPVETDSPGLPWVTIEVRDFGPGIPAQVIQRIFEPFFTTKPRGEGTGLGLCVAQRILDRHGGRLQVTNMEHPSGARFRVLLRADAASHLPPPSDAE